MLIRNPRNGEDDVVLACFSRQQVAELANLARQKQGQWFKLGLDGRIATLKKLAQGIEANKESLVNALCEDTGRYKRVCFRGRCANRRDRKVV